MNIERLDHFVLTVASIERTVAFYTRALGMRAITFGAGRTALAFGTMKINLHEVGHEIQPNAHRATPGSADLCFIADEPVAAIIAHLEAMQISVELGPVDRTGALGPIRSVYLRDPDQNLVEVASYGASS